MPIYSNTFSPTVTREYYGPSIKDPREQSELLSRRPPSGFYDDSKVFTAAAVTAGVFASGYLPYGQGRLWDKYVGVVRGIEEYSPGGIFRTFQASTWLSQFTSQAAKRVDVLPEFLRSPAGRGYASYLANIIGEQGRGDIHAKILREGVSLRGGKLFFGTGEEVALQYASTLISPIGKVSDEGAVFGRHYGSAYARSAGFNLRSIGGVDAKDARLFGEVVDEAAGPIHRQIIGARTLPQYIGRQMGAWGTEWVSRFNRLLQAPFEMQPFSTLFSKLQDKVRLGVTPGPGLRMLGALSWKYGALATGAILGYQTVDYQLRQSELLEGTTLGEGLTATLGTGLVQANLLASEAADIFGLHKYRELQEELAPGSTEFSRLLAFPLMGALGAAGIGYGMQAYRMAKMQVADNITAAAARSVVSEGLEEWGEKGLWGHLGKKFASTEGLYSRPGVVQKIMGSISEPIRGGPELKYKFLGRMTPGKLAGVIGAGIGAALITPFLPGALVPDERPEELEEIYSGEQEIGVRRGRWWEFGRTPWEGNRIAYFRPHWYPRLRMRSKEVSFWGEDEPSPLDKLLTREFTYDLEKEFYRERPYPITSLPFEDIPFIGPLLANTIGTLIKPPILMHTEEWLAEGGVKSMPAGFGGRVATELGEGPHAVPISPYSLKGTIGEQAYRMTEMIGLPGFMMTSVKEGLTGTPDLFDQMMQLESARRAYGFERSYWDLEIGGGLGTTEALRRLYPHRRRQVPLYNPIRNLMPDWLPGPGEKSPDFLHGDPYTKVPEGELRLPGKGYEARFPEVEGLSPEDYPAIHKYKILADVAPYSDKFKLALQAVRSARKRSTWSEYEEHIFQTTQEQVKQRKVRKEFEEYEYLSPMGEVFDNTRVYAEESTGLMATLNTMKANQEDESGIFTRLFGGYWELLSHNAETALDVVTPVSPGSKLVHQRTAIEDYRTTQAFGTESAFWSHPIRDFILPFLTRSAASMGFEEIPDHLKEKRGIEEYFDILEYVKSTRLSNLARMAGDREAVKEFESKKNETLFGINPYTYNYSHIFRSLPRSERDYFNSFVAADTMEERAEILSLVPENEKGLYVARWKLQFKEDVKKAKKAEMLSDDQVAEADKIIGEIESEARAEGMPSSKELLAEYLSTKMPGENYADWYRRTKLLAGVALPGPDWVGWHPSVDLEDVKLKLVQSMGEDMHQYDLWPSRAQTLVNKPYINEQTLAPLYSPEQMSQDEMKRRVDELFIVNKIRSDTFFSTSWGTGPGNVIDLEQDVNIDDVLERMF